MATYFFSIQMYEVPCSLWGVFIHATHEYIKVSKIYKVSKIISIHVMFAIWVFRFGNLYKTYVFSLSYIHNKGRSKQALRFLRLYYKYIINKFFAVNVNSIGNGLCSSGSDAQASLASPPLVCLYAVLFHRILLHLAQFKFTPPPPAPAAFLLPLGTLSSSVSPPEPAIWASYPICIDMHIHFYI